MSRTTADLRAGAARRIVDSACWIFKRYEALLKRAPAPAAAAASVVDEDGDGGLLFNDSKARQVRPVLFASRLVPRHSTPSPHPNHIELPWSHAPHLPRRATIQRHAGQAKQTFRAVLNVMWNPAPQTIPVDQRLPRPAVQQASLGLI